MPTKIPEPSSPAQQGENTPALPPAQPGQSEEQRDAVLKSGPLFLSSKGIGWTSWKKRWFVLTRTSLVFFRSDPNAAPQRTGEANLTLGGIDLNNSGSVDVKADKKLLTVLFPDGREGRGFTLKAETSEDLLEWKNALESALAQAPSGPVATAQNGIVKGDQAEAVNGPSEQQKDKTPSKSAVIGRPVLLALEEADGSPSFLEKALQFIEEHGVKTEGILRQAADVEEVESRVLKYEQGNTDFSPDEDAHVVGDCIKHVLREMPSYPVPASCCTALLKAYRTDSKTRVNAMRTAILETFPEPNRKLMQRILVMMRAIVVHKAVNRMSTSAVAACMSPLLLRPLLAGDCEVENHHMDVAGDNSLQLLQAAAAANHAQAIIITLLDEYDKIFGTSLQEGALSSELFSDTEVSGSESEEVSDDYEDDEMYEDDDEEYGSDEEDEDQECGSDEEDEDQESGSDEQDEDQESGSDELDVKTEDDYEGSTGESCSGSGDLEDDDSHHDKDSEVSGPVSKLLESDNEKAVKKSLSASSQVPSPHKDNKQGIEDTKDRGVGKSTAKVDSYGGSNNDIPEEKPESVTHRSAARCQKSASTIIGARELFDRPRWGRTSARKNLSMESIDFSLDDEDEIRRLETTKKDLEKHFAEEAKGNAVLQARMKEQNNALQERRIALEREVDKLEEKLGRERELREALEAGLRLNKVPVSANIDEKIKAELNELVMAEENLNKLRQRVDNLGLQLHQQREENFRFLRDRNIQLDSNQLKKYKLDGAAGTSSEKEGQTNKNNTSGDDRSSTKSMFSQHMDTARSISSKIGVSIDASLPRPGSKKFSSKGEQGSSSNNPSTLTKLTTRLNFLKERRNQLANELQNLDIGGRDSAPPQPEKGTTEKRQQGQEASGGVTNQKREDHNLDKKVGSGEGSSSPPPTSQDGGRRGQSSDRVVASDGQAAQNSEKGKSERQASRKLDRERRSSKKSSR